MGGAALSVFQWSLNLGSDHRGRRLLAPEFTITDLRQVYEAVWGVNLDPGNFQKKVLDIPGFLVPTGRQRAGGKGRPPELYERGEASTIEPPFRRPVER